MRDITSAGFLFPHSLSTDNMATKSVFELIKLYKKTSDKLERIAEAKPVSAQEIRAVIENEAILLDTQADILASALALAPQTSEDMKSLLWLWRREVVDCQGAKNLNEADKIILTVCEFLKVT